MDGNHVPVHVGLKPHAMAAKPSEAADERMIGDLGSEIFEMGRRGRARLWPRGHFYEAHKSDWHISI